MGKSQAAIQTAAPKLHFYLIFVFPTKGFISVISVERGYFLHNGDSDKPEKLQTPL